MNKEYLGDSVYVEVNEARQLVLTTENGFGASNTIFLEPEVYDALVRYVHSLPARVIDVTPPPLNLDNRG